MTIRFHKARELHGYLSNFAPCPVRLKGALWPSSEHYFQAQKYAGTEWEEQVRLAEEPKEAACIGRDQRGPLRADWEEVKDRVMRDAVWAKFSQHRVLAERLVGTGDEDLIEESKHDSYWGSGADGLGRNMLGRILMEVRSDLSKRERASSRSEWEVAGGSITGHAHAHAGRNNQDGFCWALRGAALVAVVCDGCGSGAHSEVGAKLGAQLVTTAAAARLKSDLEPEQFMEEVRQDVLRSMRELAVAMSTDGQVQGQAGMSAGVSSTVLEHFLFTVVGLVITANLFWSFSLGDGLIVVNGEREQLGPFPENEPPYLGYALLGNRAGPGSNDLTRFRIHRSMRPGELASALLATDGALELESIATRLIPGREASVGSLSQFWAEDRFFKNPDMVRRRLAVVNRGPRAGALSDDTTIVVVRRKCLEA